MVYAVHKEKILQTCVALRSLRFYSQYLALIGNHPLRGKHHNGLSPERSLQPQCFPNLRLILAHHNIHDVVPPVWNRLQHFPIP